MAGITFSGISTGLDSKSIIASLMTIERQPLDRLTTEKTKVQAKQRDSGGLRAKFQKLSDAANALDKASTLKLFTTTSSDTDKLTVAASGDALPGSHTISVTDLAESRSGASTTAFSDIDTTKFGAGSITILVNGVEKTIDITANQNDTLQGIRDAINAADAGVQASTIFNGTGYKMVLTSTKTGTDNAFSVSSDFAFLNEGTGFAEIRPPKNAVLSIDGLAITSQTNTLDKSLTGVTLTLKDKMTNVAFTVERDATKIGDKLQEFVDAYNDIQTTLSSATNKADATLASVKSRLTETFSTVLNSNDFGLTALSQLGITRDSTGKASIDRTKLEKAIDTNFTAVMAAFRGSATDTTKTGIADRFKTLLDGETNATTHTTTVGVLTAGSGFLALRDKSFADRIRRIDDQSSVVQQRLDKIELGLQKKYADLEALSAKFNSQSGFLSAGGLSK